VIEKATGLSGSKGTVRRMMRIMAIRAAACFNEQACGVLL
jgi:hypothetical protein